MNTSVLKRIGFPETAVAVSHCPNLPGTSTVAQGQWWKHLFAIALASGGLAVGSQAVHGDIIHYVFNPHSFTSPSGPTGDLAIDTTAPTTALSGSFDPDGAGTDFGSIGLATFTAGTTPDGPYVQQALVGGFTFQLSPTYTITGLPFGPQFYAGASTLGPAAAGDGFWVESSREVTQPSTGVPDGGQTAVLFASTLVVLGFAARRFKVVSA